MPPKKKTGKASSKGGEEDTNTRIAIINTSKCKPKKCNQECKKSCPVVKLGKLCIEVGPKSKLAFISEPLCIGAYFFRSCASIQGALVSLYCRRLRYLRQEVSFRGHQYYQLAEGSGEEHDS